MKLYNPNITKAIEKIKETGAKTICIQLPDGMKPYAQEIHDELVKILGEKRYPTITFYLDDLPCSLEFIPVIVEPPSFYRERVNYCFGVRLKHSTLPITVEKHLYAEKNVMSSVLYGEPILYIPEAKEYMLLFLSLYHSDDVVYL